MICKRCLIRVVDKQKDTVKEELIKLGCIKVVFSNISFKGTRECLVAYPMNIEMKLDEYVGRSEYTTMSMR